MSEPPPPLAGRIISLLESRSRVNSKIYFHSLQEVDGMKSSQQKASGKQSALEVRLNRALEETDKYKSALQKARSDLKVS